MEEDLSGRRVEESERRKLIGGNTPNSSSSSPPPPFLFSDEEVRVTVVTEEAFSPAHLETSANQSARGGDMQEVTSPASPGLSQVSLTSGT